MSGMFFGTQCIVVRRCVCCTLALSLDYKDTKINIVFDIYVSCCMHNVSCSKVVEMSKRS